MNQTFNLKRFALLFKKHTIEQYKTYFMSIVVLIGILFLTMGFVAFSQTQTISENDQAGFFSVFLLLSGCIFTSTVFSAYGNKKKAIPALTLPASHLEKYLVAWLYSFIIFLVVYVVSFYLVDFIIITASNSASANKSVDLAGNATAVRKVGLLNIFSSETKLYIFFLPYSVLHAITLWGAIFFEKFNFIRTGFSVFALLLILTMINGPILKSMIDAKVTSYMPFYGVNILEGNGSSWNIQLNGPYQGITLLVVYLLTVILWCSAFFRLKEKEV